MNADLLKRAIANGKAYRRKLSSCHDLLWVPDMEFAAVLMNPTPKPLMDFGNCRRMSRGLAHKCVNLMADAPVQLKRFYHDLIDGNPCGKEGGAHE